MAASEQSGDNANTCYHKCYLPLQVHYCQEQIEIKSVTMPPGSLSEPPRLLTVTLPVTRQGTSKGHQEVNNKKAGNK